MEFDQFIELTREIIFFRNYAEIMAGKLVQDLFLFFIGTLHEVKESALRSAIKPPF